MEVGYVALENFILSFSWVEKSPQIHLDYGEYFDLVSVDWMNWIKTNTPKTSVFDDGGVRMGSTSVYVIQNSNRESLLHYLDNHQKCIRAENWKSQLRDKKINKVLDQ